MLDNSHPTPLRLQSGGRWLVWLPTEIFAGRATPRNPRRLDLVLSHTLHRDSRYPSSCAPGDGGRVSQFAVMALATIIVRGAKKVAAAWRRANYLHRILVRNGRQN
eukprot:1616191-Pleurochrysis_carterae.AAC.3